MITKVTVKLCNTAKSKLYNRLHFSLYCRF